MDCQHVQQLLAFADRKCEGLDAADRDAVTQHLATCSACAALAQSERRLDEALGSVLRDVPVPGDLQRKVLNRLTAERAGVPWKRITTALAAAILIAVGGGVWYWTALPTVSVQDVIDVSQRGAGWDEAQVEKFFAERGVRVEAPTDFDYNFLRRIEIVEEFNRRVAKLSFSRDLGNEQIVRADVLILPHGQFRVDQLPGGDLTNLRIVHKDGFTYLIYHTGALGELRRQMN